MNQQAPRFALALALALPGCLGTRVTDPPAHTSPTPTLVDAESFGLSDGFDERARGLAWMDASDLTMWRLDVSSGTPLERQVQDRAFPATGIDAFRVLDDDAVIVVVSGVERDGVEGDEVQIFPVGEPPMLEWFAPGDLAVDARTLDDVWVYWHGLLADSASLCRRSAATEACYDAPVGTSGVEPQLFVGASGAPYLLIDAQVRVLEEGVLVPVTGFSVGAEHLIRRGDADLARDAFLGWYLLDGSTATIIEDGSGSFVDVYGQGERIVLQRLTYDGTTGGVRSVGGLLAGEGAAGATFWTDAVWFEIDPSTGESTEIGHETCDNYAEDSSFAPTGEGCGREPHRIVIEDGLLWILGTPIRTLAY